MTANPRAFCGVVEPVRIAKADKLTEGTAKQIEGNNLALGALCGGQPPPPPAPGKNDAPVPPPKAGAKAAS